MTIWLVDPLEDLYSTVFATVASVFHIERAEIISKCRAQRLITARHAAMYLAWKVSGASMPALGRLFNREHSTVIHGIRAIERRCKDSRDFKAAIAMMLMRCGKPAAAVAA